MARKKITVYTKAVENMKSVAAIRNTKDEVERDKLELQDLVLRRITATFKQILTCDDEIPVVSDPKGETYDCIALAAGNLLISISKCAETFGITVVLDEEADDEGDKMPAIPITEVIMEEALEDEEAITEVITKIAAEAVERDPSLISATLLEEKPKKKRTVKKKATKTK